MRRSVGVELPSAWRAAADPGELGLGSSPSKGGRRAPRRRRGQDDAGAFSRAWRRRFARALRHPMPSECARAAQEIGSERARARQARGRAPGGRVELAPSVVEPRTWAASATQRARRTVDHSRPPLRGGRESLLRVDRARPSTFSACRSRRDEADCSTAGCRRPPSSRPRSGPRSRSARPRTRSDGSGSRGVETPGSVTTSRHSPPRGGVPAPPLRRLPAPAGSAEAVPVSPPGLTSFLGWPGVPNYAFVPRASIA